MPSRWLNINYWIWFLSFLAAIIGICSMGVLLVEASLVGVPYITIYIWGITLVLWGQSTALEYWRDSSKYGSKKSKIIWHLYHPSISFAVAFLIIVLSTFGLIYTLEN